MIKIPPPLIVLVLIVSIYFSSKKIDLINIPLQLEISIFILSAGILIFVNPVLQFIKSKTTVNPIQFEEVNKLVTSGIFKYSRNPMYLGMLMIVLSTSIFYLNVYSILTPLLFILWINKFQIKREEEFLIEKFGDEYLSYKKKTRRWI
tara:strand:+ start:1548 stop:1991 length:444 start_codon:yes stop_codon:yes gene_type:complete